VLRDSNDTQELLARPARTVNEALALAVAELDAVTAWVDTAVPEWLT
jgi:hypothetical protein